MKLMARKREPLVGISARLEESLVQTLREILAARGITLADWMRNAIHDTIEESTASDEKH